MFGVFEAIAGDNRVDVGMLGYGEGSEFAIPCDLEAKHPIDLAHIMDVEVLVKSVFSCFNKCQLHCGNGKVVNMGQQDYS